MGWFLTNNKKKTKKKTAKRSTRKKSSNQGWDPQRTMQGLKYVGAAVALLLVVWGWRTSEHYLRGYVRDRQPALVKPQQIELPDAPSWMSEGIQARVKELAASHLEVDPLKPQGLTLTLDALETSPWVKYVQRVERHADTVKVLALYRQPVAVIAEPSRPSRTGATKPVYHWVDGQGVLLPVTCHSRDEIDPALPLIVGVKDRPLHAGTIWPGKDVQAALAMVREIAGQPFTDQIRALDVGARDNSDRIHIFLATDHQDGIDWTGFNRQNVDARHARERMRQVLREKRRSGVIWGLPPGDEQSIDPDAGRKIIRMISVHDQYRGSIDARGKVVDISGAAAMVLQPLRD